MCYKYMENRILNIYIWNRNIIYVFNIQFSNVESGLNLNINSICRNVLFTTEGIRCMETIVWARVLIPGYVFKFVKNCICYSVN